MNIGAGTMKRFIIAVVVACGAVGMATKAFAVTPNQVLRVESVRTFSGPCCFNLGETVSVTEPKAIVPLAVTFSADYLSNSFFHTIGISVNNHACIELQTVGMFAATDGTFRSATFEWVVIPSDGLIPGNNTITLCGSTGTASGSITLGFNTLAVVISK
jgi:hypothetical protein